MHQEHCSAAAPGAGIPVALIRDQAIARAAEDFYVLFAGFVGTTADWPIDIQITDQRMAAEFLLRLNKLARAIDPLGTKVFIGEEK